MNQQQHIKTFVASEYLKPFWQHWKIYPKQTSCHLQGLYVYSNKLDRKRLKQAIQDLVNNHDSLRSNFSEEDKQLYWHVHPHKPAKLKFYMTSSAAEREVLINNLVAKPFNLEEGDLFAFYLLEHADSREMTFIVIFHHIILDGTKFNALLAELSDYYDNISFGIISNNSELADYLVLERKRLKEINVGFWLEQLRSVDASNDYPFISKEVKLAEQQAKIQAAVLSKTLTEDLIGFCKNYNISLFNCLKILWAALVGMSSNRNIMTIAYPVSVRGKQFAQLGGSFINILPFTLDLKCSLMQQITIEKELAPLYRQYRSTPTASIVDAYNSCKSIGKGEDLFSVVIAQTNIRTQGPAFQAADATTQAILAPNIGSAYLHLEYQLIEQEIYYNISYLSPAIDDQFIAQLLAQLSQLIDLAIANPEQQLASYALAANSNTTKCNQFCHQFEKMVKYYQRLGSHW